MKILNIIRTLEALEAHGVLNPRDAIERHGFEKLTELLEIYKKASEWGVPSDHLAELFGVVKTAPPPVAPQPVAPQPALDEPALDEPEPPRSIATVWKGGDFFTGIKSTHERLLSLSDNGTICISNADVCTLLGAPPTQGTLRKITQVFDQHGFVSELRSDPTRPTRTRSRFYKINLSEWKTSDELDDLWFYLIDKSEDEGGFMLPIAFYDYLDGTEGGLRFRNKHGDLSLVISNQSYNTFCRVVKSHLKKVYGEAPSNSNMVDNKDFNRYLLARSLRRAFPKTTLKDMLSSVSVKDPANAESYIRERLDGLVVSLDIFDDTWTPIDTQVSGFVYLLAQMFLDYYIEGENRLD